MADLAIPEHGQAQQVKQTFQALAKKWREETAHVSSVTKMILHPAYQRIIGLGSVAIPLVLRELEVRPDHWLWALHAITGEDPAQPGDNFESAVKAWLAWGRQHGYLG